MYMESRSRKLSINGNQKEDELLFDTKLIAEKMLIALYHIVGNFRMALIFAYFACTFCMQK